MNRNFANIQIASHIACPDTESCESSDGASLYEHPEEGYRFIKCYACNKTFKADTEDSYSNVEVKSKPRKNNVTAEIVKFEYVPNKDFRGRNIDEIAWEKYGCTATLDDSRLAFPYYNADGDYVASKVSTPAKKFVWYGDARSATLFGRHLFSNETRKYVTVYEGECDALAGYQMFGLKYAHVSIKNGAASAKSSLSKADADWLNTFETIVVCFDNDKPGVEAARDFAQSFDPAKVKIVTLDLKDANEYLKAGREAEFREAWWRAKSFRLDGLVLGSETSGYMDDDNVDPCASYPFEGMTKKSWGIYEGQVVIHTGGSGGGKSTVSKHIFDHLFRTTKDKLGCLIYEEDMREVVQSFVGIDLGVNIKNPLLFRTVSKEDRIKSWRKLFKEGERWIFDEHFGSTASEGVLQKIRYMVHNFGAKHVLLDHISIVVSDQEEGDERRLIDSLMTKLAMMAQELKCVIHVISHLKRPDGTPHEEGGQTRLGQLRGSAGLGQLAHAVWGYERDSQNDDEIMKNLIVVRGLKLRKTGRTGIACKLWYDNNKARFLELRDDWEEHINEIKAERLAQSLGPDVPVFDLSQFGQAA